MGPIYAAVDRVISRHVFMAAFAVCGEDGSSIDFKGFR
jgi:hypothetical protein